MALPRQLRSPVLLAVIAAFAIVAVIGGALVLGGGDGNDAASDVDAASEETRLVFAEFGAREDLVYVAPASDLDDRSVVARIPHASGWALTPATEMAGSLVAFTALPADAEPRRGEPAELWLLDVETRELTRLAENADLLAAPVLDRGGRYLVYRSSSIDGIQSLVRVDLESGARRTLLELPTEFGVFPVAFTADAAVFYAELSTGGTDLYRVAEGGEPQLVVHASDDVARDWQLAPDGSALSYLAPEVEMERVVHRLHVVMLDGETAPIDSSNASGQQFSPVWTAAGDGITFGQEPGFAAGVSPRTMPLEGASAPPALTAPEQGFDVPLGWSADGRYLATRSFDGTDAAAPGRESLVVLSSEGGRETVQAERELIFIGWLPDA